MRNCIRKAIALVAIVTFTWTSTVQAAPYNNTTHAQHLRAPATASSIAGEELTTLFSSDVKTSSAGEELLVIYNDQQRVSVDGRYYIKEETTYNLQGRGTTFFVNDTPGQHAVTTDVLYDASGNRIISGEECFGVDMHQTAGIDMSFVGADTFIISSEGWRENLIFHAYKIVDGKPVRLYGFYGGDCSSIDINTISQDLRMLESFEIIGTYDGAEVGDTYPVLRFDGTIIKDYRQGLNGALYVLNNGKWIEEISGEKIDLYDANVSTDTAQKSIPIFSTDAVLLQDNLLVILSDIGNDKTKLAIYDKDSLNMLKEVEVTLEGKAFYVDTAGFRVVKIDGVNLADVANGSIKIETSPERQHVMVKSEKTVSFYQYSGKELIKVRDVEFGKPYSFIRSPISEQSQAERIRKDITDLESKNPDVRSNAALDLAELGQEAKDAIAPLIALLEDSATYQDMHIDKNADAPIELPVVYITKDYSLSRAHAAFALGEIGIARDDVIFALVGVMHGSDNNLRGHSTVALGKLRPVTDSIVSALIEATSDYEGAALWAIEAFKELGPLAKDAVPALTKIALYAPPVVSESAIKLIESIGYAPEQIIPAAIEAMKQTKSSWQYRVAIDLIARVRPITDAAVKALAEAIEYRDIVICEDAKRALTSFGVESVAEMIAVLSNSENKHTRKYAAEILGEIGPTANESTPALIKALQDKSPMVRKAAAESLNKIVSPKASSAGIDLSHLSEAEAIALLLNYAPTGIIEADKDAQAVIVYSDSLKESPALQNIIRNSAGDSRRFYLVNKEENISTDEFLSSLGIGKGIFQKHVFNQSSMTADQLALIIATSLNHNGIKQGRVFASTEEDLAAWSKQGIIEALVMLLKDKRFEIISDYSQQHMEYIKTQAQALIAA